MNWTKLLAGIVDIAEAAAQRTTGRGDDMAIALIKVLLEKYMPTVSSTGIPTVSTLDGQALDELDALAASCEQG